VIDARNRRFFFPALAGALVASVCLLFVRERMEQDEWKETPALRDGDAIALELLEPLGVVEGIHLFRWLGELPAEGLFQVRIWNADAQDEAPLVEKNLEVNFWTPNEMERIELTGRLLWEVRMLDSLGSLLDKASGQTRRAVVESEQAEALEADILEDPQPLPQSTVSSLRVGTVFELGLAAERSLAKNPEAPALAATLEELRTHFDAFVEDWKSTPEHPGSLGFLRHTKRRVALNTLVHLETLVTPGVEGRRRALARIYQAQGLDYPEDPSTLEEALPLLCSEDGGVLCFLPGQKRISVVFLSMKETAYSSLPLLREYAMARRSLHGATTAAPGVEREAQLQEASRNLASMLLPGELEAQLQRVRHLTVIGLDLLGYVPFELLPLPSGKRIEELCAVSYLHALPLAPIIERRRRDAADKPVEWARELGLLLAPPLSKARSAQWPELVAIPHDRGDRDALKSGLRHGQVEVLEGTAGNRRALWLCVRNARTLHLVLQAANASPDGRPCLLIAERTWDAGLLGTREIGEFPWPPLVRVSVAGATDAHGDWEGEGASALGRAFLGAGADVALLPPRTLTFEVARHMTSAFHEALFADELPPAEAMRRARRSVRSEGDSLLRGLVHCFGLGGIRLP